MSNIFQYFENTFQGSIQAYEKFLREKKYDEHHTYTVSKAREFSSRLIHLYAGDLFESSNSALQLTDEQLDIVERESRIYFTHAWVYFQYEWTHKAYGVLFEPNNSLNLDPTTQLTNVLTSHIIKRFSPNQETTDWKYYHYVHRDNIYDYFNLFMTNMAAIFRRLMKALGINNEYYLEFMINATIEEIMMSKNLAPDVDIENLIIYFDQVRTVTGDDTDMIGILPPAESDMGVYHSPTEEKMVDVEVNHQEVPRSDTHIHIPPFSGRKRGMGGVSQALSAAELLVSNVGYTLSHLTGDVNNPQDIEKNKAYAGVLIYGTLFLLIAMILRGKSD
jgi:hypothetical protein